MAPDDVPRRLGWMPLQSQDKRILVQVFTDLDTGLIQRVVVTHRQSAGGWWGPTTEVREEWFDVSHV